MPVTKPSAAADWATAAAPADIVAPTAPKQALGWVVEEPPHNYFNWWQNLVGQWTDYLNDLTNQVLTWAARHTFSIGFDATATGAGNSAVHGTGSASALAGKFDGGAVNANAGLAVAGSPLTSAAGSTLSGGATINGGGTVNGGLTVASGAAVTGGETVDTLNVTGTATLPSPAITLWGNPSGWVSGSTFPKLSLYKTAEGIVHVEGFSGNGSDVAAVTMPNVPAAFRPLHGTVHLPAGFFKAAGAFAGAGYISIDTGGNATAGIDGSITFASLFLYSKFNPNLAHG